MICKLLIYNILITQKTKTLLKKSAYKTPTAEFLPSANSHLFNFIAECFTINLKNFGSFGFIVIGSSQDFKNM